MKATVCAQTGARRAESTTAARVMKDMGAMVGKECMCTPPEILASSEKKASMQCGLSDTGPLVLCAVISMHYMAER